MTTAPRFNGRAERIRAHLAAHPKGVTLRALIIAIEPGCKAANMNSSLHTLMVAARVRSTQIDGVTHFHPTPTTFVDGRIAANAKAASQQRATRPASTHVRAARAPTTRAKPTPAPASVAIPQSTKPAKHRTALSGLITNVESRRHERDELAADVAAFLAAGGVIQRFKQGESAASIAQVQARFLDTRQRGRGTNPAPRAAANA